MNVITRCPGCQGRKKVFGIGLMERDCERCAGKGTVAVKPVIVEAIKEEEPKHERETEVKTVAEIKNDKRKYIRKTKETPAKHGVCDVA